MIPGEFTSRIEEEIDRAQIALLIVSQAFLNSKFIEEKELPMIKARKEQGKLEVVPVLVGSCGWDEDDFLRNFHILPGKPTPLIQYTRNEAAWDEVRFEILDGLKKLVKRIRATQPGPQIAAARGSSTTSTEISDALRESVESKLYRTADHGDAAEQFNLGVNYEKAQDEAAAAKCYRKAAEQGHVGAQYYLGSCYEYGKGVAVDEGEAMKWYRKAAGQGLNSAIERLNILSVSPDKKAVVEMFVKI